MMATKHFSRIEVLSDSNELAKNIFLLIKIDYVQYYLKSIIFCSCNQA